MLSSLKILERNSGKPIGSPLEFFWNELAFPFPAILFPRRARAYGFEKALETIAEEALAVLAQVHYNVEACRNADKQCLRSPRL